MTVCKLIFLVIIIVGCTLPPNSIHRTLIPNEKCCAKLSSKGECYEELVPGCASNSAPLFQEKFLEPDECCELWGRNGFCYKEKVKGCSSKINR